MKKVFVISILGILISSFRADQDLYFTGKILYKHSFTDLKGNDITEKLVPYFGKEQHYFIDSKNYKAIDENKNLIQLYNSETNTYYYFNKDKTAKKFDGATKTSEKFSVTKLDKTEMIAGYECHAIQVETDKTTTIYFFSPRVKTNYATFAQHYFGEWNKYLEASAGALSLKFVTTDHKNGYIWISTATEVSKQNLDAGEFVFPGDVKIKD